MLRLIAFARRHLIAEAAPLSGSERLRSTAAALAGFLLAEAILAVLPVAPDTRRLLAPLGATSVILFSLPHSPLAQPWSVAGGLLLSAGVGLVCGHLLPLPILAAALAVAASIWLTAWLRCLHPPGGALALSVALAAQHADPLTTLAGVGCNVAAILISVMAINNVVPGRRYPQCAPPAAAAVLAKPSPTGIGHEDLRDALAEIDAYLDISEEDLIDVFNRATEHAFRRHVKLCCRDVMTPAPVAAEFATELNDAWRLLRQHGVQALPVIDRARRVIGLVSLDDFLRHVAPDSDHRLGENVRRLLRATPGTHSSKPEVVGQIMRGVDDGVFVVAADDDLAGVAARLGRRVQHSIPVVDAERRLLGILTPTDLVAALFNHLAIERASPRDA